MNSSANHCQDLGNAIQIFLTELPDVNAYAKSSITESFFVDGKEVKLKALKTHGMQGAIWDIDIVECN